MIKLNRLGPPTELTAEVEADLTAEYLANGTSVWRQDYIVERLLAMSHDKCAYCETKIDEESKYLEVDHIANKSDHPSKVVRWSNLLPSCKRCNVRKSAHNIEVDGALLDPTIDDPRKHIRLRLYRFRGKDDLGRRSIEAIYLNDSARLVRARMNVGESIMKALAHIREKLELHKLQPTTRRINRVMNSLEDLFAECLPSAAFGATAATVMLEDDDYHWIRDELHALGRWGRFTAYEAQVQPIALS
jgi:uncharacterized protein (TIGR02646 family)